MSVPKILRAVADYAELHEFVSIMDSVYKNQCSSAGLIKLNVNHPALKGEACGG